MIDLFFFNIGVQNLISDYQQGIQQTTQYVCQNKSSAKQIFSGTLNLSITCVNYVTENCYCVCMLLHNTKLKAFLVY